jgi:glycosyltransferase involved in cell wall biosynthesis
LLISWTYAMAVGILYSKKNKYNHNKKILALPYYPLHYAGGQSRIADWKPYFENNNIQYDIHWASETNEFLAELMSDNWLKKYLFYATVLLRRFKILFTIRNYDVIWVQRAFVPFYPFKDSYFEKIVRRVNDNFIIDFYDADYESNFNLTLNAARAAKKVTVASLFLVDNYKKHGIETSFVRFAFDFIKYKRKVQNRQNDKVIIGWMGAPNNFINVVFIEEELLKLEEKFANIEFHFICRELMPIKLKRFKQFKWGDEGFDYYACISRFDIGIAPMIYATERDKAKTAFKTLEYMASGIAMAVSPWGISDKLTDGVNCIFIDNKEDWFYKLNLLIEDPELRKSLGINAGKTIEKYHSYENVFDVLKNVLISN